MKKTKFIISVFLSVILLSVTAFAIPTFEGVSSGANSKYYVVWYTVDAGSSLLLFDELLGDPLTTTDVSSAYLYMCAPGSTRYGYKGYNNYSVGGSLTMFNISTNHSQLKQNLTNSKVIDYDSSIQIPGISSPPLILAPIVAKQKMLDTLVQSIPILLLVGLIVLFLAFWNGWKLLQMGFRGL